MDKMCSGCGQLAHVPWDGCPGDEDWQKEDPTCFTPDDDLSIQPGKAVPWPTADALGVRDWQRENRIEALRAASRIVAGMLSSPDVEVTSRTDLDEGILLSAETYARWLEDGKR